MVRNSRLVDTCLLLQQKVLKVGLAQVVVVIPEVPGFAGNIKDASSLQVIMAAQYRTINRGGHSIYEEIRKAGYEP